MTGFQQEKKTFFLAHLGSRLFRPWHHKGADHKSNSFQTHVRLARCVVLSCLLERSSLFPGTWSCFAFAASAVLDCWQAVQVDQITTRSNLKTVYEGGVLTPPMERTKCAGASWRKLPSPNPHHRGGGGKSRPYIDHVSARNMSSISDTKPPTYSVHTGPWPWRGAEGGVAGLYHINIYIYTHMCICMCIYINK